MTKDFLFYDVSGVIKLYQTCTDVEADAICAHTGYSRIQHSRVDLLTHVVYGGEVVPVVVAPETAARALETALQTSEEMAAGEVRRVRNMLLLASDWTQLPDVPQETREKWAGYRQTLRDVTEQSDPLNISWPTPPQ